MSILLKINTVDKTSLIDWRSLQKQQIATKEPDTLTFDIINYPAKTYRPALGDDVKLYDVDGTTLIFGGIIISVQEKVEALVKTLTVNCKDYSHTLDRKLVTKTYTGQTVAYIVNDLITTYATGFTCVGTTDTTIVTAISFNYLTISECLKKLVNTLGAYSWYVDYNKDVKFTLNGTSNAPFNLSDTSQNFIWESLNFNSDISQLRNHIILRGGTTTGTEYVDYKIADGQQNTFFVGYDLVNYDFYKRQATPPTATFTVTIASPAVFTKVAHGFAVGTILTFTTTGALPTGLSIATNYFIVSVPTADTFTVSTTRAGSPVTTSGTQSGTHTYTVAYKVLTNGLDGVVDPTTVDVVYNPTTGLVRFANTNTPALNDVVRWVGTPTYPLIAQKLDLGSISTYGTYQQVIIDANITTTASAGQRLTSELAKWSAQIDGGSFDTKIAGLLAGQNIGINSTIRNVNKTFKIDRITTRLYKPDAFIYSVEVVTADVVTMNDVLNKLLVTNVSDQIDIGLNEVLQVLYSASETVTLSESVTISTSSNPQSETVTMGESTTVQALNYAVIFCAGAIIPTGTSRQFILEGSPLG
jgi:hypothetical protein